jgi:hypothetical protein
MLFRSTKHLAALWTHPRHCHDAAPAMDERDNGYAFLPKPFGASELAAAVRKALLEADR